MAVPQRTYQLNEAAGAANMSPHKLRHLIDRGVISLRGNDVKPSGSGTYCGLSRNRVLQATVTQRLTDLGVSVSRAALLGLR
jgi:hypothetical protein